MRVKGILRLKFILNMSSFCKQEAGKKTGQLFEDDENNVMSSNRGFIDELEWEVGRSWGT